jgi:hypothetical protein
MWQQLLKTSRIYTKRTRIKKTRKGP